MRVKSGRQRGKDPLSTHPTRTLSQACGNGGCGAACCFRVRPRLTCAGRAGRVRRRRNLCCLSLRRATRSSRSWRRRKSARCFPRCHTRRRWPLLPHAAPPCPSRRLLWSSSRRHAFAVSCGAGAEGGRGPGSVQQDRQVRCLRGACGSRLLGRRCVPAAVVTVHNSPLCVTLVLQPFVSAESALDNINHVSEGA